MTSAPSRTEDGRPAAALQAILLEAKAAGVPKPTRTALVKYLYLLDVFYAEETAGQTWTGLTWRFHHFGPYSDAAVAALDRLVEQGLVVQEDVSTRDRDYSLYQLGEWSKAVALTGLGIPTDVRLAIEQAARKFAADLYGLLDYVYFRTAPMRDAFPGDQLSFLGARKVDYKEDVKLKKIPLRDKKTIERIKQLVSAIGRQYATSRVGTSEGTPPIFDNAFSIVAMGEDSTSERVQLLATLRFDRENEDVG